VGDKIQKSLLLFAAAIVFGIAGYMLIEGWSFLDALYMTIITLGTVGFGETHPLSPTGRIFTVFLIIFGLGTAASVINSFGSILLEQKLNSILGRKNMQTALRKLNNHVILGGFGQIGKAISLKLQEKSIPFVVIDELDEEIKKAEQLNYLTIGGNVTSDVTLLAAGIKRASCIVICISDLTVNLTLALAAKELNPGIKVIARGTDRALESRITRAGADIVVYPVALGGEQISRLIAGFYNEEGDNTDSTYQPVDGYYLKMHRHFHSTPTTIEEIINEEHGLWAVVYKTASGEVTDNPQPDVTVSPGDSVIVLLNNSILSKTKEMMPKQKIEWSEDYSVGDASIDEEHLRLMNIINDFNQAIITGQAKKNLAKLFDSLVDYTVKHFKNEEQLMRAANYHDLEAHIEEHRAFVHKVMALNKEKDYVFSSNISSFLHTWLLEHILDTDKKYQPVLKKKV
jgi:hemerythrin-like metal-binding protein